MSRVHKYRAWDKNQKVMVEVDELRYFPDDNDKLQLENIWFTFPNSLTRQLRKLENIELMEFTGLLDKNGVEIYEGDIIKHESKNPITREQMSITIWEVKFGDYDNGYGYEDNISGYGWYLYPISKTYRGNKKQVTDGDLEDLADGMDYAEIIGNCFENPEYLEE